LRFAGKARYKVREAGRKHLLAYLKKTTVAD